MSYCLILTTASSKQEAGKIADKLVRSKLAACVTISSSVESRYRWERKVQKSREWMLFIKSRKSLQRQIEQCIKKIHSYDVPEILVLPIRGGSRDYLNWIREETKSKS